VQVIKTGAMEENVNIVNLLLDAADYTRMMLY
jgi:hypothetical protein